MIHVLHLQGPSDWGGNLKGILTLFKALDRNRFHPIMGGPESSGYLERFSSEGFETIDIPLFKRWDIRGWHCLNQAIRKHDIQLLHTHVRLTDWLGGWSSRWMRIPCISTIHAPFQYTNDLQPLRDGTLPIYGWVLRNLVDQVITVSEALRNDVVTILKIPPDHVTHVINGIDVNGAGNIKDRDTVRTELGIPSEVPVLIHVGWFGHRKGQMDVISVLPEVLKSFPDTRCIFVGEGKLYQVCQAKVSELGLTDSVQFLGFRWDAMDVVNAADIVVFPTYCEGLPRVLLEAGLLGKPVISTRVDGVPELVIAGETGLLVNPGDRAGLAIAIKELLANPEQAEKMGQQGRNRVLSEFTSQIMARSTEEVYCRVLKRRRIAVPEITECSATDM